MQTLFLQPTNVFGSHILDFQGYQRVDAHVGKAYIPESIDVASRCRGLGTRAGARFCSCVGGLRSGIVRGRRLRILVRRSSDCLRRGTRACQGRMREIEQCISRQQRSAKTQQAPSQSNAAHSRSQRLEAEDAHDAVSERTVISGHGENRSAAPLLHQRQSACVFHRVTAE